MEQDLPNISQLQIDALRTLGLINTVDRNGKTALDSAIELRREDAVSQLLQAGADPNIYGENACPPLILGARNGDLQIVKVLLEHNAPMNLQDDMSMNWTALHMASFHGYDTIVDALISKGADASLRGDDDELALHLACQKGFLPIVEMLLKTGCSPNEIGDMGMTPLHYALRYGQRHLTHILVTSGANVDIIDEFGRRPFDYC